MIKLHFKPVIRIVAIGTGITEKIFVYVVLEMTVDTFARGVAMFCLGFVTANAIGLAVRTEQIKVGEQVIEARFIEIEDVGVATFMVGMA